RRSGRRARCTGWRWTKSPPTGSRRAPRRLRPPRTCRAMPGRGGRSGRRSGNRSRRTRAIPAGRPRSAEGQRRPAARRGRVSGGYRRVWAWICDQHTSPRDVTCVTLGRMKAAAQRARRVVGPSRGVRRHRWLVFIHQLPAQPSNARVKICRRMQQIGAVAVKNAVYVLPNNEQSREDFEWLRAEVAALGGEATIFAATSVKGLPPKFEERQVKSSGRPSSRAPHQTEVVRPAVLDPKEYRGRVWVTRPRPGVDRFASAWLIRRFVDAEARFVFGSSPERAPGAVPFDMYQAGGFKHEGDRCTFEVLCERFAIAD